MKEVHGDLIKLALEGEFDAIVHGCNCFHKMGGGIARTIKDVFPEAYQADLATVKGDRTKLGSTSTATVERNGHEMTIVNAYTQYDYWSDGVNVDYDAVKSAFELIAEQFPGKRIGYPMIGAGLAGGDWDRISEIIDQALEGEDHTLVVYVPDAD